MYGMGFVMAFLTLYMLLMTAWVNMIGASATAQRITLEAEHMAVYSSFVSQYAQANSGYTGSVSDASAGIPTWFKRLGTEKNYVTGGVAYIYSTPTTRAEGLAQARAIGANVAGIVDSGILTAPGQGATGKAIPGAVPNGSLVIVR
ncbi:MAG: hypothetical protein EPN61_18145 [Burkholderiaceae bacterium]|nr:MAG: hypothetical protein EPN61_18145 [Burkholderiaceae bacterium]